MSCVLPVTFIRSTPPSDHNNDGNSSPPPAEASTTTTPSMDDLNVEPDRQSPEELSCGRDPLSTSPPAPPHPPGVITPRRMLHPRRVKSAVIVAAGLSTRMFPASAVVKKELFPIVDHDGVCKPVILAIMEGLAESGIERFVVVVQEKDIPVFDDFFSMKAVEKHKHRRAHLPCCCLVFVSLWPSSRGCFVCVFIGVTHRARFLLSRGSRPWAPCYEKASTIPEEYLLSHVVGDVSRGL